ncbi:SPOR domain-containing protein [Rhodohalobacter sp. 8-1]|uniref:SPOR domain-containing protein n=1 Tax=Rhodohalobacter sp. 8-1 TaxID=3131972 RepID=UPI0030ED0D0B
MTIDREELISLLEEKTGMTREDVEAQLDELISRILDASKRGKALEIKGFGLFYFDEGGKLTFRASDKLDSEINFSHAGMEPVELEPPKPGVAPTSKKQPEEEPEMESADQEKESDSDQTDADDVFGIGKTLAGHVDDEDDDETEILKPFGKLFQEEPSESDVKPEPTPKEDINKAGTAPAKKASDSKRKTASKSRDPMNTIIVVVLAGVFLFAAYFVFTEFINPPEQPETSQQQDVELEDPPVTAERDITAYTEPEPPQPVQVPEPEDDPEPLDDPIDEVTTTDPYGLYGDLAEPEGDVFTIVVHSLRDRGVAEQTADELRQEGFRITVNDRVVDGQTYYRVGIGQFPTIREAQQEATTLPEPFNNDNFIQRIQ